VLISSGTLFLTFLAVVFVRWVGSQQMFAEPPHPWFASSEWIVKKPDPEQLCSKIKLNGVADTDLIWIPVHFSGEEWRVKCAKDLPLNQVLAAHKHPRWLIFVEANDTTYLDKLVASIQPFDKNKSFGVLAPSQLVARSLRKQAPQWVYAADAATLLRLHIFTSFWIETAFDFWPDFIVQLPQDKNSQISERELRELQRRKKRVIALEPY
jgi:hypothetical protein